MLDVYSAGDLERVDSTHYSELIPGAALTRTVPIHCFNKDHLLNEEAGSEIKINLITNLLHKLMECLLCAQFCTRP